jgi:hypothetical protein
MTQQVGGGKGPSRPARRVGGKAGKSVKGRSKGVAGQASSTGYQGSNFVKQGLPAGKAKYNAGKRGSD